ncbi:MAG: hypothetical protein IPF54_26910 [Draconibacterium sp.]|nr:hypothetical protein [Draconibacterium sp.]
MTESSNSPKVEFIYTPVANYAIQQNRIPIIRKLVVENPSDEDLLDLKIEIKVNLILLITGSIELRFFRHTKELKLK